MSMALNNYLHKESQQCSARLAGREPINDDWHITKLGERSSRIHSLFIYNLCVGGADQRRWPLSRVREQCGSVIALRDHAAARAG